MKDALSNARKPDSHAHATNMDLLKNPLEFLEEDHLRTRMVCAALDRLAESDLPAREDIFDVLSYLENELPLFIVDEDTDFDRLLRRRAADMPDLLETLERVSELHKEIAFRSRPVIGLLQLLKKKSVPLTYSQQACLQDLAKVLRVDMVVENATLLPLAKRLLTDDDLAELRSAMFQRRLSDFRDHRASGA